MFVNAASPTSRALAEQEWPILADDISSAFAYGAKHYDRPHNVP